MVGADFPVHLKKARKWYRLGYVVLNTAGVAFVVSIPGTYLWEEREGGGMMATPNAEGFAVPMTAVGLSILAFFALQGSDPGYLWDGAIGETEGGVEDAARSARYLPPDPGEVFRHVAESDVSECTAESTEALGEANIEGDAEHGMEERLISMEAGGVESSFVYSETRVARRLVAQSDPSVSGEGRTVRPDFVTCSRCRNLKVPLRSRHCRQCGRCVATFDHHCNLIGTCIGERNHCRFWWFLAAQAFSLVAGVSIVSSGFKEDGGGTVPGAVNGWFSRNALALVASALLWPCVILSLVLLGIHTWMALSSMTTFECVKGPESLGYLEDTRDFDLPFSEGLMGNLRGFCCARDGVCWWHQGGGTGRRRDAGWRPRRWKPPGRIVRDSEDWRSNLWENKYWSCC